ncbi:hypothetical protein RB195_008887 [Necator americanus]|uniref:SMB domain-containing protein n=1 Tax=Necator americanus TaxID=51031 RepID=A0ABR1CQS6_NECAM
MFSLSLVLLIVPFAEGGCYQRRMCCTGRNTSCKAIDDGIRHLPTMNPYRKMDDSNRSHHGLPKTGPFSTYQTPYYEASGDGYDLVYPDVFDSEHHQRIGKVVFPDVIELEGSGAGDIYLRYAPTDDDVVSNRVPKSSHHDHGTSPARKITHFLFGYPEGPDQPPEDIQRYTPKPKHLLIRYSILSQHIPLTVSTTPTSDYYDDEDQQLMYLEAPPTDCYCDETCVVLGDCCSDYTFVCPRRDCAVSSWGPWENCVADDGVCGIGVQQRTRYVTQKPERGGQQCPPLKEMRTCHTQCSKRRSLDDITTVALLLDYRYNDTRSKMARDNIYWDLPSVHEKLKEATYYCVKYKIGWVNRNCWHKQFKTRLYRGNTICAECQPEATLHRNNGRCASDLEDGEQGFWKLIGPKSCNGMWTRIGRDNNCHCSKNHADLDPFLIV